VVVDRRRRGAGRREVGSTQAETQAGGDGLGLDGIVAISDFRISAGYGGKIQEFEVALYSPSSRLLLA